jgi:Protein of unknown function (DUF3987)
MPIKKPALETLALPLGTLPINKFSFPIMPLSALKSTSNSQERTPFDIRDHLDKLTHHKVDKFVCPVCNGTNLSISKKDSAYKCWDGCSSAAIREVLAPWADRAAQSEPQKKAARPKQTRQWTYADLEGNPCIRVNRTDDGGGKKRIWQEFWAKGVWTTKAPDSDKTKLKAAVTIYRHPEVLAAIAEGRQIFWVEGEPCADLLWSMGLAATTSIGGSAAYESNGNYSQALKGARLVVCPDRDANGLKYAEFVATDYPESRWLYAIPESPVWGQLPQAGGLDIADWVIDYKITADDIVAAIEPGQRAKAGPIAPVNNLVAFPGAEQPETIEKSEVEAAIELSQTAADIAGLLPTLYLMLATKATRFNVPVETLVGMLLAISGSLLPSGIQLKIEDGYYVPPIVWTGLVGDSGATKTPILQTLAKSLQWMQGQEYEIYQLNRKHYEKQMKEWGKNKNADEPDEPEKLRHYYTSDFTIESVIQIVAGQPKNGLAVIVDELAGFVNSFGEYKSGGGSDRQKWLSSYSGLPIKSDRKSSGTLMADRANINVAGTIQPSVLRKLMGDTEQVDGLWPRFLWFGVPTTTMPAPGETPAIDITDVLTSCYRRLASPAGMRVDRDQSHIFSPDAEQLWIKWHHFTEARKMAATSQSVQAIYPKAREQAARVALIAHHIEAAAQGIAPTLEISLDTLSAAISLVKYCVNQSLLIYGALGATADNPDAIRIAKFIERFAGQEIGWKTVRPILPKTRVGKTRRNANKSECVAFLRRVVELGFGVDHGDDCLSITVNEQPVETEINYEYTESEVA